MKKNQVICRDCLHWQGVFIQIPGGQGKTCMAKANEVEKMTGQKGPREWPKKENETCHRFKMRK